MTFHHTFGRLNHTLTTPSLRAWNNSERHEYDLVRVHATPMHHQREAINEALEKIEEPYLETGSVRHEPEEDIGSNPMVRPMQSDGPSRTNLEAAF